MLYEVITQLGANGLGDVAPFLRRPLESAAYGDPASGALGGAEALTRSLAASVGATVFDGGRLRAQVRNNFV